MGQDILNRVFILLFILNAPIFSQTIFPNLFATELRDSLAAHYKTNTVFSYDKARDTLFAKIYTIDDTLTGVYTGKKIWLDPAQDPTTYAFSQGINTEHTYPQSKGAVGQAKSDMHHLYPVRGDVNSSRGNDPFANIADVETDKWYRLDTTLTTIPQLYIEEYSEKDNDLDRFEPREDHKGNVARAMIYFYTMYKKEADSLDSGFFWQHEDVIRQWHLQDPPDSLEVVRNELIASYQGGYLNPYILDSTLVERALHPDPLAIRNFNQSAGEIKIKQYPNPFNSSTTIQFTLLQTDEVTMAIYNIRGQLLKYEKKALSLGTHRFIFNSTELQTGIYFYRLSASSGFLATHKMVLVK
jgi:hypothetical protein